MSASASSGHQARPKLLRNNSRTRQDDPDFGELPRLRVDLNRPAMLLDDDVMADGETKPCPFSGRLGREERIEDLFLHLRKDAGAVVAYADFDTVPKVLGRGSKGWLVVAAIRFRFALGRRIKAVGDQVEQRPV